MVSSEEGSLRKGHIGLIKGWSKVTCHVYTTYVRPHLGNSQAVLALDSEATRTCSHGWGKPAC